MKLPWFQDAFGDMPAIASISPPRAFRSSSRWVWDHSSQYLWQSASKTPNRPRASQLPAGISSDATKRQPVTTDNWGEFWTASEARTATVSVFVAGRRYLWNSRGKGACEEGDGGKMLVGEEKEKKPRERPPLLGSEKGLVFGT